MRATSALLAMTAMLTSGALACTFDRSGSLEGVTFFDAGATPETDGSLRDGAGVTDATDEDTSTEIDTGAGSDAGSDSLEVGTSETGPDATGADAAVEADVGARDVVPTDGIVVPTDVAPPPPDGISPDADAAGDGPDATDARAGCAAYPNASAFTPPGASTPHCYWLQSTVANWLGAADACTSARGHLLTLSSDAETTFALGLVSNFPANDRLWIGGTDGRFSGDGPGSGPFVWISGEAMSYVNWYSDATIREPDGRCDTCGGSACYCEHRVAMRNDGRWEDGYEAVFYRYVCEAE